MMMMRHFTLILLIALAAGDGACEPATSVPATAIASGSSVVVNSQSDPQSIINVRVDIGTLRQIGDAIEAELTWTLRLGMLNDTRALHPGVTIPEGSASVELARIVCRLDGELSYSIETRIVAPDGNLVDRRTYDAAVERKKAEEQEQQWARMWGRTNSTPKGYSPNPFSLVCWAAARKCEGRGLIWPPPPNNTPLEYSERATKMQTDYNRQFVPRCRLPE
jgi:hypothetical protein